MNFFKELSQFVGAVARDERIPARDRKLILILLGLVVSPIDLIPDWIPFFGLLDDIVYLALIFDYLFNILDESILLSHYPWGMRSYVAFRRPARVIATLSPRFLRNRIWKYQPSPYRA